MLEKCFFKKNHKKLITLFKSLFRTTKREQSFYDGIPYLQENNTGSLKLPGICHMPMHPLFSEALKTVNFI